MRVTMMLADHAQVADGKLFISGGGWSVCGPGPVACGVAVLFHIPWQHTNEKIARSEEHTAELQSHRDLPSFPTRRSSDLFISGGGWSVCGPGPVACGVAVLFHIPWQHTNEKIA